MAKARALDRRRKSIRNIRKITRTMELIATARFKGAMDRAAAAAAYTRRITTLVSHLAAWRPGGEPSALGAPSRGPPRGGAGAFGQSRTVRRLQRRGDAAGAVPLTDAQERSPGNRRWTFRASAASRAFAFAASRSPSVIRSSRIGPRFDQVEPLAQRYLEAFLTRRLDRLDVVYTRFESISRQYPAAETLLPLAELGGQEQEEASEEALYEFLPSAASILEEVVPASFKIRLFKCFLDAAVSEQIARMLAMKAATENADTIISNLSMTYNRARQSQITSEILEVIGGAETVNK